MVAPIEEEKPALIEVSPEGTISVNATSIRELKLALKQLKLEKKKLLLLKKQASEQERQIRANYTDYTRNRGSMIRGGGTIGKFIRLGQTVSRDGARRALADQLAPYEQKTREIAAMQSAIEELMIKVEIAIEENS